VTDPAGPFQEAEAEVLRVLRRGVDVSFPPDDFNEMALEIFRLQCRAVPAYGAFVSRRGVDPAAIGRWEDVPFLPAQAFKSAPLVAGGPSMAEAVFQTSGTTRGKGERGRHFVRSLELYRASLLPNFRSHLFPDGEDLPVLALLPAPDDAPESSLTFMVEEVRKELCGGRGGFFGDPRTGLRNQALHGALREAEGAGSPVLLAGTAFAYVHWMETAAVEGWRYRLPEGSRILETGGFKGRSRVLTRRVLYQGLEEVFGVPVRRVVNEYGMTELLSQFYEPVLGKGREGGVPAGGPDEGKEPGEGVEKGIDGLPFRWHRGPPWVRTRILHPLTLAPVPEGETGILAHLDLANIGSVSAILTEDLGRRVPGGFQLQGRIPGAESRGCSLAMEDFLAATEGGRYAV